MSRLAECALAALPLLAALAACSDAPAPPRACPPELCPLAFEASWSHEPPAGHQLRFDGVVDREGRLYWLECPDCLYEGGGCPEPSEHPHFPRGGCWAASADASGRPRFRVALPIAFPSRTLIAWDRLVVLGRHGAAALSLEDGTPLWRSGLSDGEEGVSLEPMTADADALYAMAYRGPGDAGEALRLALADGSALEPTERVQRIEANRPGAPILGRVDGDFVVVSAPDGRDLVIAGGETGRTGSTADGRTLLLHPAVVVTSDRRVLPIRSLELPPPFDRSAWPWAAPRPVLQAGARALVISGGALEAGGASAVFAAGIDLDAGVADWRLELQGPAPAASLAAPFLSSRGTVLLVLGRRFGSQVGAGPRGWSTRLLELGLDGTLHSSLELPGIQLHGPGAAWTGRRLVLQATRGTALPGSRSQTRLVAFELRGPSPATRGWITSAGSQARTNRPAHTLLDLFR